jgi:hypothetical protein
MQLMSCVTRTALLIWVAACVACSGASPGTDASLADSGRDFATSDSHDAASDAAPSSADGPVDGPLDLIGEAASDMALSAPDGPRDLMGGDGSTTLAHFSLAAARSFPAPSASHILGADFNGDGKPDVISLGQTVVMLLGDGNGGFAAPRVVANQVAATSFDGAQVGDFDRDGKIDLIASVNGGTQPGVYLFRGNGDGTLQTPVRLPIEGSIPKYDLTIADLNQDGKPDLLFTGGYGILGSVLGNGDGTIGSVMTAPAPQLDGGAQPAGRTVATGDLDSDGKVDAVISTDPGLLLVYRGKGDGTFANPTVYDNQTLAVIRIADVDKDGKLDLVSVDPAFGLQVRPGRGDGSFGNPLLPKVRGPRNDLAIGDFDGDGKVDFALEVFKGVSILFGSGGGLQPFAIGGLSGTSFVVEDVNGDQIDDLVTANPGGDNVSVLLGRAPRPVAAPQIAGGGFALVAADLDGDGRDDIAALDRVANQLQIQLAGPQGLSPGPTYPISGNPSGITAGDLNGDRKVDLVVADGNGSVNVYSGNGDGTFASPSPFASPAGSSSMVIADMNGDGTNDVVVGCGSASSIAILSGNGDGTLQAAVAYGVGAAPGVVTVADLDGDGHPDIASTAGSNVIVLMATRGTFRSPATYAAGSSPSGVKAADIDGDGRIDLVATSGGSANLSVLLGNGDGTFLAAVNYPTVSSTSAVVIRDLDGDGVLDIAATSSSSDTVSILLGRGGGQFARALGFIAGGGPRTIAAGDFTGDGRIDLVTSNYTSNSIGLLANDSSGP